MKLLTLNELIKRFYNYRATLNTERSELDIICDCAISLVEVSLEHGLNEHAANICKELRIEIQSDGKSLSESMLEVCNNLICNTYFNVLKENQEFECDITEKTHSFLRSQFPELLDFYSVYHHAMKYEMEYNDPLNDFYIKSKYATAEKINAALSAGFVINDDSEYLLNKDTINKHVALTDMQRVFHDLHASYSLSNKIGLIANSTNQHDLLNILRCFKELKPFYIWHLDQQLNKININKLRSHSLFTAVLPPTPKIKDFLQAWINHENDDLLKKTIKRFNQAPLVDQSEAESGLSSIVRHIDFCTTFLTEFNRYTKTLIETDDQMELSEARELIRHILKKQNNQNPALVIPETNTYLVVIAVEALRESVNNQLEFMNLSKKVLTSFSRPSLIEYMRSSFFDKEFLNIMDLYEQAYSERIGLITYREEIDLESEVDYYLAYNEAHKGIKHHFNATKANLWLSTDSDKSKLFDLYMKKLEEPKILKIDSSITKDEANLVEVNTDFLQSKLL